MKDAMKVDGWRKAADRRYFLGGSDARIIMGNDEAALMRLWREKRGEVEPEDLSRNQPQRRSNRGKKARRSNVIDKGVLAFPEPRRIRDREHVRYVTQQCCLICGRRPSDAHHLRFAQSRALSRKVSDEFTVPLCRGHHREVHRSGDEAAWWTKAGINPTATARALWLETHPLPAVSEKTHTEGPVSGVVDHSVMDNRPPRKRGPSYEKKPIEKLATPQ